MSVRIQTIIVCDCCGMERTGNPDATIASLRRALYELGWRRRIVCKVSGRVFADYCDDCMRVAAAGVLV